jgi:hypothetical protein
VPPNAWHKYCKDHQFLGPGCLYLVFEAPSKELMFVEAAIYWATFGCYPGMQGKTANTLFIIEAILLLHAG